jgi:hypothetical protein
MALEVTWKPGKLGGEIAYEGGELVGTVRETEGGYAARFLKGQNNKREVLGDLESAKQWIEQRATGGLFS